MYIDGSVIFKSSETYETIKIVNLNYQQAEYDSFECVLD